MVCERKVWLTRWGGGEGDPSLRLKGGSTQDDTLSLKSASAQDVAAAINLASKGNCVREENKQRAR